MINENIEAVFNEIAAEIGAERRVLLDATGEDATADAYLAGEVSGLSLARKIIDKHKKSLEAK